VVEWLEDRTLLSSSSFAGPLYDFGDAPDGYGTTLAADGARHDLSGGPWLGPTVDADADGQPDALARGDDTDAGGDDEDGVVFNSPLVPGQMASIDVTVSGEAGFLDAWVDFSHDGDWDDPDDKLVLSQSFLSPGTTTLSFPVPASAVPGLTFARFRISTEGVDSPTGEAMDGEVEDYQVVISPAGSPGELVFSTADVPWGGVADDGVPDVLELRRNGLNLELLVNRSLAFSVDSSLVTQLVVQGSGDDDLLSVDFSTDNPIPPGGLRFDGLGQTSADSLQLLGGSFSSAEYTFTGATTGTIMLDSSAIDFAGLEPILDNLDVADRVFTYADTPDAITLSDDGTPDDGVMQIVTVGTAESVAFASPTNSLTINAGGGDDTVAVTSLDSLFAASVLIDGGAGDDQLGGTPLADTLLGGPGNDQIYGLDGDDSILGGDGSDSAWGHAGNDTLDGGSGDNFLVGSEGDDLLLADNGNDTLDGQAGNDSLFGAGGYDSLLGGDGNDYVNGQGGSWDTVSGGPGDDWIKGGRGGADLLFDQADADLTLTPTSLSGAGSDLLFGIERAWLTGGAGANRLDVSTFPGRTTLDGAGGDDTLIGGLAEDRLLGGDGNDVAFGSASRDTLNGQAGDDSLFGQGSNDVLLGGEGNDWVKGAAGTDYLSGGPGSDTILGNDGNDLLVEFARSTGKLLLSDTALTDLGTVPEVDVLVSIERARLVGTNRDDWLDASAFSGQAFLYGFGGNDTLVGGSGDDLLDGGKGDDALSGLGGQDSLFGGRGSDVALGGDGNDRLDGGTGSDTLLGEAGDDLVEAVDGRADTVSGGGNGIAASAGDVLNLDAPLDQIDDAFAVTDSWVDGWP